ncbi:MAG: UDP-N-acetylmuramoyl-L-alanine--D-glutamate ligase [Deltaproteobacteria bacterium]
MAKNVSSRPFSPAAEARARVAAIRDKLKAGNVVAAVVGGGKSGEAAIDLLRSKGAEVRLFDDREITVAGLTSSPIEHAAMEAVDVVVLSPGVPRRHPELQPAITRHKLVGEVELASWFVRAPMVGITGTNGKSTTTALVGKIFETAGRKVFAGGNLGEPLSRLAMTSEPVDVAVVELSSYQLESIVTASFRVGCWLNIAPDHTDRYDDLDQYAAAKRRVLDRRTHDGVAVLNAKDPYCSGIGVRTGGPIRWFAGAEASDLAGPMGTQLSGPSEAVRTDNGVEERYQLSAPWIVGTHNKANACAAIECARAMGVAPADVQAGLDAFGGLPHRLELVRDEGGTRWFNDSKATNIESVFTALTALAGRRVVWIAGGRDKGAPWAPLAGLVDDRVEAVLAIGEAASIVEAAFGSKVERVETLERAVARARELAGPGVDVLLAPGCASFDQFKDYAERGDVFRRLVGAIA